VQRLTLSTLNSAARNKPYLIQAHLAKLLPLLYAETALKQNLIRIVEMGPWKHRVDDGLEARKTAYETMYTLVSPLLSIP
jgi:cullin-associated NEDD8-dissociated protein 1